MSLPDDRATQDLDTSAAPPGVDAGFVGPHQRVDLPVFRPRRSRGRSALLLAVICLAISVGLLVHSIDSSGSSRQVGPLAVVRESIRLAPTSGVVHCPQGLVTYTAHVVTNGGSGRLVYQWVRPDGTAGPVSRLADTSGRRSLEVRLAFTFSGPGRSSGVAMLRIISPARSTTAARVVAYSCP